MKKILTNYDIITIINGTQKELFSDKTGEFNLKFAWKLNKNIKKLIQLSELINEKMQEIERQYADDEHSFIDKDDNNNEIRKVKDEYAVEFTQKRNEVLALENEVDIEECSIDDIGVDKISPAVLSVIEFMLKEE